MTDISENIKQNRRGVMFIISAPSGTGKSSVIKKIMAEDVDLKFSISVTTRKPREGEKDGVDYYFISDEQFQEYVENDAFYEYVDSTYGSQYGTLRSEVDKHINVGKDVIFDVDVFGLRKIKNKAPKDVVSIYILPPSVTEVRKRLIGRGTDSMEIINKRMSLIADTLKTWNEYDYVVINENLDEAVKEVKKIIAAERIKRTRQPKLKEFVEKLLHEAEHD